MVKMLETFRESPMDRTWLGLLYADAKEDITEDMEVIGLPMDYSIEWGSEVITAAGDIGQLTSDGTWAWVGDEETASALTLGSLRTSIDNLREVSKDVTPEEPEFDIDYSGDEEVTLEIPEEFVEE